MVPLAFLILGSAAVIVNISKTPLDAFAFPVGDWYITGSRDSVTDGALLWAVALSAVSCLYFLSLNTTMTDILEVLRKLHVPPLLIELMLLIYRFIFVLLGNRVCHNDCSEIPSGKQGLPDKGAGFRQYVQRSFYPGFPKSERFV